MPRPGYRWSEEDRRKHSKRIQEKWKDPEYRKKQREARTHRTFAKNDQGTPVYERSFLRVASMPIGSIIDYDLVRSWLEPKFPPHVLAFVCPSFGEFMVLCEVQKEGRYHRYVTTLSQAILERQSKAAQT